MFDGRMNVQHNLVYPELENINKVRRLMFITIAFEQKSENIKSLFFLFNSIFHTIFFIYLFENV